jgi:predicted RNA-binding protein with TRAM domain
LCGVCFCCFLVFLGGSVINGSCVYCVLRLCAISPKKRAPRNAKNKRGSIEDLPVQIGEEYDVEIVDVTPNGEGIAKVDSFSVFVKGAQLHDRVKVQITRLDTAGADGYVVS